MAECVRSFGIVIIIAPFRKVIGKLKAWYISTGIFKVDDNKLFVLVGR